MKLHDVRHRLNTWLAVESPKVDDNKLARKDFNVSGAPFI
jgi:hypothetical protein